MRSSRPPAPDSSNTEEDSLESSAEEGSDGRRMSYAQEKLCGKRPAVAVGPAKKRKAGVSTRVLEKPVVIGGGSPWRRWQLVLSSSSDDNVPAPPLSSPPVTEEVLGTQGDDVDLGSGTGEGTAMTEPTLDPEEPVAVTPSVEVLSTALPEREVPEARSAAGPRQEALEAQCARVPKTTGVAEVVGTTSPGVMEVTTAPGVQASGSTRGGQG